MNIAIIPARGGSKRIPRKNIRDFCGKPMIAWSIEAALKSGIFARVLVSTDDPEIREISNAWGAEAPFDRPPELANDHAGTQPVIRHAVQWLLDHGLPVDRACCLYATAPFTTSADLRIGLDILANDDTVDFAFSITPFEFPIQRALKLNPDHEVSMFWPEHEVTRSQDLPTAYHDAGQFYWATTRAWLRRERIYSAHSRGIILPPHKVQDIDTEEDWLHAEFKFKSLALDAHA
jgi:pseudaminic acid cytidylyltransferase